MFSKTQFINHRNFDLATATIGEGALILIVAAIAWATRQPLIFASLGPTAYELVEKPRDRSSRARNIVVGHLVGLGAGFLAVYLFHCWNAPNVEATGILAPARLWAVTVAATLTTFVTLLLKASQPAAVATSLLVAVGSMQTGRDAAFIIIAVLIITAIGEPLRHLRIRIMNEVHETEQQAT